MIEESQRDVPIICGHTPCTQCPGVEKMNCSEEIHAAILGLSHDCSKRAIQILANALSGKSTN